MGLILNSNGPNLTFEVLVSSRRGLFHAFNLYPPLLPPALTLILIDSLLLLMVENQPQGNEVCTQHQ